MDDHKKKLIGLVLFAIGLLVGRAAILVSRENELPLVDVVFVNNLTAEVHFSDKVRTTTLPYALSKNRKVGDRFKARCSQPPGLSVSRCHPPDGGGDVTWAYAVAGVCLAVAASMFFL